MSLLYAAENNFSRCFTYGHYHRSKRVHFQLRVSISFSVAQFTPDCFWLKNPIVAAACSRNR